MPLITLSNTGKFVSSYKPLEDNIGTFKPLALPGLGNLRHNCGSEWALARGLGAGTAASSAGCHTLNGTNSPGSFSAGNILTYPKGANRANFTGNSKFVAKADDNGLLGTWGACTEHQGSQSNAEGAATRNMLRQMNY